LAERLHPRSRPADRIFHIKASSATRVIRQVAGRADDHPDRHVDVEDVVQKVRKGQRRPKGAMYTDRLMTKSWGADGSALTGTPRASYRRSR
jgi:hypothetical protein